MAKRTKKTQARAKQPKRVIGSGRVPTAGDVLEASRQIAAALEAFGTKRPNARDMELLREAREIALTYRDLGTFGAVVPELTAFQDASISHLRRVLVSYLEGQGYIATGQVVLTPPPPEAQGAENGTAVA